MRAALVALLALVLGSGCRSGSTASPSLVTTAPGAEPKASMGAKGAMTLPAVRVVLDDPRLVAVRELEIAKDPAAALRAMREARPADLPVLERCAWDFVEGRLALAANSLAEAVQAFDRARTPECPLVPYATLRSAQALARGGHADEAIDRAGLVPADLPARDEAKLVIAEALAMKNDRAGALSLWREWLAANPYGNRWLDTSVRIANALLDGVAGPPETHARDAYDLATKVVVQAPKLAETSGAAAARSRAVVLLKQRDAWITEALSHAERAAQAQALLDTNEPTKAFEVASSVVSTTKAGPAACKAAVTRANAAARARGNKTNGWPDAIVACEKEEQLVTALYSGAKAHAGKDPKRAIDWFHRVEARFPSHRLADDARYRAALLVAQSSEDGQEERAEQMLRSLPDTYPNGDMRTEALFRVALKKMQHGDWVAAKPVLERILEIAPDDRHWATAGRAEYFRARADAVRGDPAAARAGYARVVEQYPLTFYMLMAHARLAAIDASQAAQLLKEAALRDADGVFPSRVHPILQSASVTRAARLLEVGEVDAARREVHASGALADDVDPEVVWSIGALYNQAGLPDLGHSFSRTRLTDFLAHYPEGRWRIPWEVAYPRAFANRVLPACTENAIPTSLAWGIMREESSFVPEARSHSNAIGLMQLIPSTAKWMASGTSFPFDEPALKTPQVSIALGTRLLAKLRKTHGHPALAIGAYNAGGGAVERWVNAKAADDLDLFVELVPYDETRNYIKRVLSSQAAYAYLYEPANLGETIQLPLRLGR